MPNACSLIATSVERILLRSTLVKSVATFCVKIVQRLVKIAVQVSTKICSPYHLITYVRNVRGGNYVSNMVLFYDANLLVSVFFRRISLWID